MSALKGKRSVGFVTFVWVFSAVGPLVAQQGLRRIRAGAAMPAFSLATSGGQSFVYDTNDPGVLGLVILKTGQDHFGRIADDLEGVVKELKAAGKPFDCVGVMSGPGAKDSLATLDPNGHASFPVLLDPRFELWGKLGVIAAPTAVVVGADGKVRWAKAGYGYDFIPTFHAQLAQVLGIAGSGVDASAGVKTLENTSGRARLERHAQMARSLAKRGRLELAVSEFRKAQSLDPDAVDVVLELGELLCRLGENQAALKAATEAQARTGREKARVLLISGWARRQMGELDAAESLLVQSLGLDARSPRALYELGQTVQAGGDFEKATSLYRRALALVFDESEKAVPSSR